MSLLLDALKKVEQTRTGVAQQDSPKPDELARTSGHRLFAAKAVPTGIYGRFGVIPLAVIGGLLLAAGGGYYVWHEISSLEAHSSPTPSMLEGKTAQLTTATAKQPISADAANDTSENAGAEQDNSTKVVAAEAATAEKPEPSPLTTSPRRAAAKSAQALHIDRNQSGDEVDSTLLAAWQTYRNGDFATAWQLYRTVLQRDAKNRDALLGMAAIARQQGRDDVAAQYYGHVLALDPRDPAAHAGMSTLTSSNAASTESKLKLQLAYRPDAPALHFALGNLYAEQSRWAEANQAYLNAYNRNPDDAQFAFNLAVSLDHLGQGTRALPHYQRALQLDRSATSGINRAQVQQRVNELTAP